MPDDFPEVISNTSVVKPDLSEFDMCYSMAEELLSNGYQVQFTDPWSLANHIIKIREHNDANNNL